jgi:hypothetical protein
MIESLLQITSQGQKSAQAKTHSDASRERVAECKIVVIAYQYRPSRDAEHLCDNLARFIHMMHDAGGNSHIDRVISKTDTFSKSTNELGLGQTLTGNVEEAR